MTDPANLVRLPTDAALAIVVRAELTPLLEQICNLAGKKQMVAMLVAQKSTPRPAPTLAHDSATTGELDAYRKQHGLTARAVKRV